MVVTNLDQRLREKLKAAKINQNDLARYLGRNQPWVHKVINGGGAHVTIDEWIGIATYLGQTLNEFLRGEKMPVLTPEHGDHAQTLEERKLLQTWRKIPEPSGFRGIFADLIVAYLKLARRRARTRGTPQSSPVTPRTPPGAKRSVAGKPRLPQPSV